MGRAPVLLHSGDEGVEQIPGAGGSKGQAERDRATSLHFRWRDAPNLRASSAKVRVLFAFGPAMAWLLVWHSGCPTCLQIAGRHDALEDVRSSRHAGHESPELQNIKVKLF